LLFSRYENVYNTFYRVERCGALRLTDGGGPFGFDILIALLFDDLIAAYRPDGLIECGSSVGDTTAYLACAYPDSNILSCDIDPFCVMFTRYRTSKFFRVTITQEHSIELIARVNRLYAKPLFYLDAHGYTEWPLASELRAMTHGIAVVHDFDIGHPRFSFDCYDGVPCNSALLADALPAGKRFYKLNALAETPFPCLQVGRRAGVAIVPLDDDADRTCVAVAESVRRPLIPA
jgi:hypothetical protein